MSLMLVVCMTTLSPLPHHYSLLQEYIDRLSSAQYAALLEAGLRIDPRVPKSRAATDIEPEFMALSDDGKSLYVTLQASIPSKYLCLAFVYYLPNTYVRRWGIVLSWLCDV